MKYNIVEYHYDLATKRQWDVRVKDTSNRARSIARLAQRRRAGDMPPTLSHWMVGNIRVAAQTALQLCERQEVK